MRQVREVLRLKHVAGHSERSIAAAIGISRYTVAEYLRRATVVGITWPVPAELDDSALEARLFSPPFAVHESPRPQPDWPRLHAELRRPGVTLLLLWEEYRAGQPDGYGYSRFCDLYRDWRAGISPTMRQTHVAGERLFVDFAGQTVPITDPLTGAERQAQIFVAALGASNYTYAEARWSQGLADWIGCHVNALTFFGGVTRQIVCDNLRAGVTAACRYEPGINRTYQEMATHYGTAIVPTRVRKPRDKAKVEVAVQVVERWVLARLRHRRFFSLGELNDAIRELIDELNTRVMRRTGCSRRAMFEALERTALLSLPSEPFEYAEWKRCRPGLDYHIEVHRHLVFGALPPDPRGGGGTHHRPHGGDLPSRCPRRCACPQPDTASPHHAARPHAERTPALRRLDTGQAATRGRSDRSGNRRAGGADPQNQTSP
jgi:transposase